MTAKSTWETEVWEAIRLQPIDRIPFVLAQFWERYLTEHPISFANGTVTLVNWVANNPHFEFKILVVDSYRKELSVITGEPIPFVRPLSIIEGVSVDLIYMAKPEDLRRCPVIRWFHRTLRRLYQHEADEQFLVGGEHIFDPHNPETRLSDQSLF